MEKIPSFTIDHNRLLRGIYVSRKDKVGAMSHDVDIRMKEPNREPALHPVPSTPSSIWPPPISATTRNGRTASSIGARWAA